MAQFRRPLLITTGAVLQITAITQVVTNVGNPLSVAAYAAGVGAGVLAGLVAGERPTPGTLGVTITTTAPDAAAGMWARGWPAIAMAGRDRDGQVTVLFVPINRRHYAADPIRPVAQKLQCSYDHSAIHPLHAFVAGPATAARTSHDGCQRRRAGATAHR